MRYLWSIVFSLCLCTGLKGQQQREWGKWESWGDQGDGTYMNPVIPSDYSDIDCIRAVYFGIGMDDSLKNYIEHQLIKRKILFYDMKMAITAKKRVENDNGNPNF